MIDLGHAANDLIEAVSGQSPDFAGVHERVRRRRRVRRLAATAGVATILVAAVTLAASVTANTDSRDQIRTGPAPGGPTATAPTPDPNPSTEPVAQDATLEVGAMRLVVPAGWTVDRAAETGGCGGPTTVVIGSLAPSVGCVTHTGLRIVEVPATAAPAGATTTNGIPFIGPVLGDGDAVSTVRLPTLGASLEFAPGVDPTPFLASVESTGGAPEPVIEPGDSDPAIDDIRPLVLPCGIEVVADRGSLALPPGLDVAPETGLGGWLQGTGETCAVHYADPDVSYRHVTFGSSRLPFAIGEELGGRGFADLGLRFGTIEAGYGAEMIPPSAPDQTFHVMAYGLTEDEFVALVVSLAPS